MRPFQWVRVAVELASDSSAPDADREAAGLFFAVTAAGSVIGVIWAGAYLLLGRPLSAAFPGVFGVVAAGACVVLVRRHRIGRLRELIVILFLLLPFFLQVSFGGYVKGSAVVMWAFMAPLGALVFFGARAAVPWLAAFLFVVAAAGMLDSQLTQMAPSLPPATQTFLFALNMSGVAALVTLALTYFRIQRDHAIERSESLLLNVLPPEIAVRLKRSEYPIADRFEDVGVLFADLVGFTVRSAEEAPEETVAVLNEFLSAFDRLADRHGVRPIRTLGDSYVAVSGVPVPRADACEAIAEMGLDMLQAVDALNRERRWSVGFRIGINIGPAIAAVVGRRRFTYDVWSDAVNTASRMESSGVAGRIQVTEATYRRLRDKYRFEPRGEIEVKGKGRMHTYFLVGRLEAPAPAQVVAASADGVESTTAVPSTGAAGD
jgi:guanylate cyclase